MTKLCTGCGQEKPEDAFYESNGKPRGRRCKQCHYDDYRRRKSEYTPEQAARRREQIRRSQAKYYAKHGNSKHQQKAVDAYKRRWPKKAAARRAAQRALAAGKIVAPSCCERCGMPEDNLQMHHTDYNAPLSVVFLCHECHGKTRRID